MTLKPLRATLRQALILACSVTLPAQAPSLAIDRASHDFGRVSPKTKVSTRFELSNAGGAVLEIREVQTTCGCTSALPGLRFLKPGASTTLEVQYDPARDRGIIHRGVSVFSNDPRHGRLDLELVAEVVPSVVLSDYACFLSGLLPGDVLERTFRCSSSAGKTLHLKSLAFGTEPWLAASAIQDGKDLAVNVKLDASRLPAGQDNGRQAVTITTDDPDTPAVVLAVYWNKGSAFRADPAPLAFPVSAPGASPRMTLKLAQVRGRAFRILQCAPSGPAFKVEEADPGPAAEHTLTVLLASGLPLGTYSGKLVFTTDDPDQATFSVEAMACVR